MHEDRRLQSSDTLLLVIDVQERLAPVMAPALYDRMLDNLRILGRAQKVLNFFVVMSEQYPKGLGPTVSSLREAFCGVEPLPKQSFSVADDTQLADAIAQTGCKNIVVAGIEAHICVYQSVRDLAQNHRVDVLADAVASRTPSNVDVALGLFHGVGARVSSTETVLFDMLGKAGTDPFKAVSKLVR